MTAFWVIAILLFLLLLWLLMQPKQGTRASNAPNPSPVIPDALPSGEERDQTAEMGAVDDMPQEQVRPSMPSRSLAVEVQQLLDSGQKIAAIKRVRAVKQWGLREAKEYVDALSQQKPPPIHPPQSTLEPTPELRQEVLRLLTSHRKLHAVKLVREQTGCHLYEAKNYVDAIQQAEFQAKDNAGATDWSDPALWEEVKDLLAADRTFDAVERVRCVTGCELRQALEYIATVQQSRY
jgi:ribosomal protein L7/L12